MAKKNVGIVLWLTWLTVENNFDLFKTFNEWGVKGLKIDLWTEAISGWSTITNG